MGWLVRIVVSSATLIGGCAALAGIDDGATSSENPTLDPNDTGTDPGSETGSSGGGGREGGTLVIEDTGTAPDTSTTDAAVDSAVPCPKLQNDETCAQGSECCSMKCNEQKRCKNSCKPIEDTCDVLSTNQCCIGLFCTTYTSGFPPSPRCKMCIAAGLAPEAASITGTPLSQSCCSRTIQGGLCM